MPPPSPLSLPSLALTLTLTLTLTLLLTLPAPSAAQHQSLAACIASTSPDTTLYTAGGEGFDAAVGTSLFPYPQPSFVAAVPHADAVPPVVRCARHFDTPLCVRSGGHSFTGKGLDASCLLVDVIALKHFSHDGTGVVTVGAGNTLGEMFLKTFEATSGSGVVGIGLCPSVGVAGYVLGGGFNPMSASLGLTCERIQHLSFVLADGRAVTASAVENRELFWASCGGGGGAFAILTSFSIRVADATKFNSNVYFRYRWPQAVSGQVAHKHVDYDDEGGNTWVRVEFSAFEGAVAYGVCWASFSVQHCQSRLGKNAFFNVPGRETIVAEAGHDVTEYQRFIGPAGDWARRVPDSDNDAAFIGTYGSEAGLGPKRSYQSMFTRYATGTPPQDVFDRMAAGLAAMDKNAITFNIIQFNPWRGAERSGKHQYAFPHRDSDQLIEFIGANDKLEGEELKAALDVLYRTNGYTMAQMAPWRSGIYVNYPEFGLADDEYPSLYFGSSLTRLTALRDQLDPTGVFTQKQQIPSKGNKNGGGGVGWEGGDGGGGQGGGRHRQQSAGGNQGGGSEGGQGEGSQGGVQGGGGKAEGGSQEGLEGGKGGGEGGGKGGGKGSGEGGVYGSGGKGGGTAVRMAAGGGQTPHCEGLLGLRTVKDRVTGQINPYPFGELSGLRAEVRISTGCSLGTPLGVGLLEAGMDGVYEVVAHGGRQWSLGMEGEGCELDVVSVNRIACGA